MDFQDIVLNGIIRLLVLVPALTFHEFAHAYFAYRAGDPTPAVHGRVTLNPLAHLDPLGTLMLMFGPIGWAKPVPINPTNFRYPSRDIIVTSAAGPVSNLLQGTFWGIILRVLGTWYPGAIFGQDGLVSTFLVWMVIVNFSLALFNLIPLGVLDGHHIMEYMLPYKAAMKYRAFNRYGMAILIGLILMPMVGGPNVFFHVVVIPALSLGKFVTGINLI